MILSLSCLALIASLRPKPPRADASAFVDPRRVHGDGYVGSDVCRACHPYQHATWSASYHHTMTQVASPQAILAPFDGTELHLEGATWRVERRGDEFWVTGAQPAGNGGVRRVRKRIVMTTGSHNYQLYWMEADPGSRMSPFPLVYLPYDRVWIPRKSRFLTPPVARTPAETGRWSAGCIKCHATHGQPQDPLSGETRVAELGISCEACHGPGAAHAAANRSPLRRFALYLGDAPDSTIVNPRRLPHDRSTQVCGQCHAIEVFVTPEKGQEWIRRGSGFRPGADLFEYQTLVSGRYENNPPEVRRYIEGHPVFRLRNCFWPDGMLRVAGREYQGMLETPCYRRGEMACTSCHRLHRPKDDPRPFSKWADDQLGIVTEGDGACLRCHRRYDTPAALAAHSHHAVGSSGSRCYNCHMPYTSWGLLRGIRSHAISSPDVATSLTTGRPNACNLCHLDRSLRWAADTLEAWYGIRPPKLDRDEEQVAASILWALSGDGVQRALMAWSMGWEPARRASGTRWMVPYLCQLLLDPCDAVRFRAQRSLRLFPAYRAMAEDSVVAATRERQAAMREAILAEWSRTLPAPDRAGGPGLLLRSDGTIDQDRFARLVGRRNDDPVTLSE